MKKVTERQKELLKLIYCSLRDNGYSPSFEELKGSLGVASNQAVYDHLESLEKKNLIKRGEHQARNIKITSAGCRVLGVNLIVPVAGVSYAGNLSESYEIADDWQELSKDVKRHNKEVFLIKVSGDSMINAGINDGDTLLAQEDKEFKSGDIVLAETPEGTTIKRFISDNSPPYIYLKPENPEHKIIQFTHEMTLKAKIIGKWIEGKIVPLIQGSFEWQ